MLNLWNQNETPLPFPSTKLNLPPKRFIILSPARYTTRGHSLRQLIQRMVTFSQAITVQNSHTYYTNVLSDSLTICCSIGCFLETVGCNPCLPLTPPSSDHRFHTHLGPQLVALFTFFKIST